MFVCCAMVDLVNLGADYIHQFRTLNERLKTVRLVKRGATDQKTRPTPKWMNKHKPGTATAAAHLLPSETANATAQSKDHPVATAWTDRVLHLFDQSNGSATATPTAARIPSTATAAGAAPHQHYHHPWCLLP